MSCCVGAGMLYLFGMIGQAIRQKAVLTVVLLSLGVAFYAVVSLTSDDTHATSEAQPTDHASQEQLDKANAELHATIEADTEKPIFSGRLGAFEVVTVETEVSASLCEGRATGVEEPANFVPSELNQPGMTAQTKCADGKVVATYSLVNGRRAYFLDVPRVHATAPLERLETLEIGGHPAIIIKPVAGLGTHFVHVLMREPSKDKNGIMFSTVGKSYEAALAAAQKANGQ